MSKTTSPPHGNTVYPWSRWTNGKWHTALAGQHFQCRPESFVRALRYHARGAGLTLEAHIVEGSTVTFRFMPQASEERSQANAQSTK